MAGQNIGSPFRAFRAGADLSDGSATNRAVVVGTTGLITRSGAGAAAIGLLTDAPKQGEAGSVQVSGGGKWRAAGSFNAGIRLMSDANGLAVAATATNYALAIASEASTGANHIVSVEIVHAGSMPA